MRRLFVAVTLVALSCSDQDDHSAAGCAVPFVMVDQVDAERHSDLFAAGKTLRRAERLTHDGVSLHPRVSPDGERVAFVSGIGSAWSPELGSERTAVFIMGLNGQDRERVSNGDRDRSPDWSPDGERLVFDRDDTDLVVLSLADETEHTIGKGSQPSWSPAGDLIAFTVYEGVSEQNPNGFGLWVSGVDGSDRRRLANWAGGRAVWSPDGTHLAFADIDDSTLEGTVRILEVATGDAIDAPGSRSRHASVIAWTTDDNLIFVRNVRGPEVEIVASEHGTARSPMALRKSTEALTAHYVSDNPTCTP